MKHPNAFYVGDELLHGSGPLATKVTVAAFVKPAGGRQLVRVRFPDGSCRNVGFDTLRRQNLSSTLAA